MRHQLFTALLSVAFAGGVEAADVVVLGTSNMSGQISRLSIANRAPIAATVNVSLLAGNPGATVDPVSITIAPMATVVYEDALAELWHLANTRGVLTVSGNRPLLVTAGKYRKSDTGGRAGSPLPVLYADDLFKPDTTGNLFWIAQSGDPAVGTSSNIELYAAAPGTEVEIAIFNADGTQIVSRKFSSGPAAQVIPVASLVNGEFTVARAEVRVKAGRATAALELVDNVSGQRTTTSLLPDGAASRSFTLAAAFHATDLNTTRLRTDLRLFNPGLTSTKVTASYETATYTVDLAPKTLLETDDVLAAFFGADIGAQGTIQLTSSIPIVALERTVAVNPAADPPVEYDDIHLAFRLQPLLTTGSAGVIGGLRAVNARMMLSVRAGTAFDVSADLGLRDSGGQFAGRTTLAVDKGQTRLADIGDLFPGVSIPEDAILEITPLTGDLDAAIFGVDSLTGDADYLAAQPALIEPACIPPEISYVTTTSRNLTQAGDVTFTWETKLADSVALQPVSASVPAASSFTTRVSSSTTFKLIAKNACGETPASIAVSVGSPNLRPVSIVGAPAGAGGQPGQLFTVNLTNVGDASALSRLILRDGARVEMEIPMAGFSQDGLPYAVVPLLSDVDAAARYRTGAFTLTAVVNGRETAAIPFNIVALPAVADPVAAFRTILDRIAAAGQRSATDLRSAGASAEAVQAALTTAGLLEADLRKMLNDVTASGRATLTHGLRLTSTAATPSVAVTRADLAAIVAANNNYLAASTPVTFTSQSKTVSAGFRSAGTCLADKQPYVGACKTLEDAIGGLWQILDSHPQVFNGPDLDAAFLKGRTAGADYITGKLRDSAIHGVLRKVNLWVNWTSLLCALQPIRLLRFDMVPGTFLTGYPRGDVTATALRAILVPKYANNGMATSLEDEETNKLLSQLPQKYNDTKLTIQATVHTFVQGLFGDLDKELSSFRGKYASTVKTQDSQQVGKCDIAQFYAQTNGPDETSFNESTAHLIPAYASDPSWGRDTYYFQSRRKGAETMCIRAFDGHFLLSKQLVDKYAQDPEWQNRTCVSQVGPVKAQAAARSDSGPNYDLIPQRVLVHTTQAESDLNPSLTVDSYNLNAWCVCEDQDISGITSPGIRSDGAQKVDNYNGGVKNHYKWRNSEADLTVEGSGGKWTITLQTNSVRTGDHNQNFHDALIQVGVSFTNPVNSLNDQSMSVHVQSLSLGACSRPLTFFGLVGASEIKQAPTFLFQPFQEYFVQATRGSMTFTLGGELTGFPSVTNSCLVQATIETLTGPPPAQ